MILIGYNKIKIIIFLVTLLSVVSCASKPDGNTSNNVKDLMKTRGPHMACTQPDYKECLGITYSQCIEEMNYINDACFNYAVNETKPSNNEKEYSYMLGREYGKCMAEKHFLYHAGGKGKYELYLILSCINEGRESNNGI